MPQRPLKSQMGRPDLHYWRRLHAFTGSVGGRLNAGARMRSSKPGEKKERFAVSLLVITFTAALSYAAETTARHLGGMESLHRKRQGADELPA